MAIYYISATGNDNNNGTTIDTPWQTLTKVNAATFTEGDSILFNRGDTFHNSLTINQSGVSGNPIIFGAYGTGVNPVITGFTTVTAWTNLGSNIWESSNAVSTLATCNMVTIGGVNTAMGRYPSADQANGGYLTIASHSGKTSLTCSTLTGTPDWAGAEVVVRTSHFTLERSLITSQSTTVLNYTALPYYEPTNGFGFFIQNNGNTLTYQNSWYYNPTTFKIRIYSTSQPTNVSIASVDKLITITASYVTVNNISFTGANNTGIWGYEYGSTYTNDIIQNCSFNFMGQWAVSRLKCNNFTISNNTIANCNTGAIKTDHVSNLIISHNTIANIGLFQGMGTANEDFGINAAISTGPITTLLIEYNNISEVGMNGISSSGTSIIVRNNFIQKFCNILDDGAGIYGLSNATVYNNICINGIGAPGGTTNAFPTIAAGIYCDDNSTNTEIYNNSTANTASFGIFLNGNTNINVHNNTIYNASAEQFRVNAWNPTTGIIFNNNIVVAKETFEYCLSINSGTNDIPTKLTSDNNYYCRPINETTTFFVQQPSESGNNYKTLAQWKTFSGQDTHSLGSPQTLTTVNDFQFEYNATLTAKTVTLTQPMIDVTGTKYVGSTTLQPFTSIVMMKDYNPAIQTTKFVITSNNKLIVSNNQVLTEMI